MNSLHEWGSAIDGLKEARRVLISGGRLLLVEHPHGNINEEGIKKLGDRLDDQLQSVGFKSTKNFVNSIDGRVAVGIRGEKSS